jgi:hypothetical protein
MQIQSLKWEEPIAVFTLQSKYEATVSFPGKSGLRKAAINQYLTKIRSNFIIALLLLTFSAYLIFTSEPGSKNYILGLTTAFCIVGIGFGARVILNLLYAGFSSKSSEVSYELSDDGVVRFESGKEMARLNLADLKNVQLKETRYLKGSRWFLRIKHRNRKWYELEIPYHLHGEMEAFFKKHTIPFSTSSKPRRGIFIN